MEALRTDLVAVDSDARSTVELDGSCYHPSEKLSADMLRQGDLEKLNCRSEDIRGSAFFRDPTLGNGLNGRNAWEDGHRTSGRGNPGVGRGDGPTREDPTGHRGAAEGSGVQGRRISENVADGSRIIKLRDRSVLSLASGDCGGRQPSMAHPIRC